MTPSNFAVGDVVVWAEDQDEYRPRYDPGPYLVHEIFDRESGIVSVQVVTLDRKPVWYTVEGVGARQVHKGLLAERFRKDVFLTEVYKATHEPL